MQRRTGSADGDTRTDRHPYGDSYAHAYRDRYTSSQAYGNLYGYPRPLYTHTYQHPDGDGHPDAGRHAPKALRHPGDSK